MGEVGFSGFRSFADSPRLPSRRRSRFCPARLRPCGSNMTRQAPETVAGKGDEEVAASSHEQDFECRSVRNHHSGGVVLESASEHLSFAGMQVAIGIEPKTGDVPSSGIDDDCLRLSLPDSPRTDHPGQVRP